MAGFVPDRADLVWLTFDPQAGHEQSGRRPVLVLSSKTYNQRAGLALVCPITSHVKGYPFEVLVEESCGIAGAILADQIKSCDWKARRAERIGSLSTATWEEVLARVAPLLGL